MIMQRLPSMGRPSEITVTARLPQTTETSSPPMIKPYTNSNDSHFFLFPMGNTSQEDMQNPAQQNQNISKCIG
jgi:hypothetical protein